MKKLYKKVKFKTEEEWLENRSIGGSSASALLGYNPYMNAMDIYLSHVNPKKRESHQTQSTQY